MKRGIAAGLVMIGVLGMVADAQGTGERWPVDKAREWYAAQPWLVGCNFIPSSAINQLEMWQADTFDPETIDRELGWAAGLGFDVVRVYLHDLAYEQDPDGLLERMDRFLGIAAKHNIRVLFVFFDDCWLSDPHPGKQPEPWPGVHNSGWVESPGLPQLKRYPEDAGLRLRLETYVEAVLTRFREDERILMWDLYNEPSGWWYARGEKPGDYERGQTKELCLPLLRDAYAWARDAAPTQPLTTCHFGIPEVEAIGLEQADIVTFHHYGDAKGVEKLITELQEKAAGRPVICTEYMSRGSGSMFKTHLPIFEKYGVGAINWGLVAGKSNTIYPWSSWKEPGVVPEPELWFHDIFRKDGSPYDASEVEFVREIVKKANRNSESR